MPYCGRFSKTIRTMALTRITETDVVVLDIFSCQTNPTKRLFKKL